jgi:hypothetical protein
MNRLQRLCIGWASIALSTGLLLAAAGPQAAVLSGELLQDAGFEPGAKPLQTFFRGTGDPGWTPGDWNAESAVLTVGPQGAITPSEGTGMLNIMPPGVASGVASDVSQIIDVSNLAATIDRGGVTARVVASVNSPGTNTTLIVRLRAAASREANGVLLNPSERLIEQTTDQDAETWESVVGELEIPVGTRYLSVWISAFEATMPPEGIFVDASSVQMALQAGTADCLDAPPLLDPVVCDGLLTDGGLDSTSAPLQSFSRGTSNPWQPGEWNAEYPALLVGPDGVIAPVQGDGMLRIEPTGGVMSDVSQIIDLSACAGSVDNGNARAHVALYVNAPKPGAVLNLIFSANDAQESNGTLDAATGDSNTQGFSVDADPRTWERVEVTLDLKPGRRFLSLWLAVPIASITGAAVYVDDAAVEIGARTNAGVLDQPLHMTVTDGLADNFANPVDQTEPTTIGARLSGVAPGSSGFRDYFDEGGANKILRHTIGGLPPCIGAAHLTMRIKAVDGLATNDTLGLGNADVAAVWSSSISDIIGAPWNNGDVRDLTLDLSALPLASGGTVSLLDSMNTDGALDITLQDDTAVDYVRLDLEHCRCTCLEQPSGMIAWFPLDEPAGSVAHETVGGNHGSYVGGPTPVADGLVDYARAFNGQGSYVQAPHASVLNLGTGDLSVDAWIRTDGQGGVATILDKRFENRVNNTQGIALFLQDGKLAFQLADGPATSGANRNWVCSTNSATSSCTNYVSSANVADGQWHLVAVTVDRNLAIGGTFYVDGRVVGHFNPTGRMGSLDNGHPLRIASRSSSVTGLFRGQVDELELFNRALSSSEINEIYQAYSAGKCRDQISFPEGLSYCYGLDTIYTGNSRTTICNHGAEPRLYNLSYMGLPAGYTDASLPDLNTANVGPTGFNGQAPANLVQVDPGACEHVLIRIPLPAGHDKHDLSLLNWRGAMRINVLDLTGATSSSLVAQLTGASFCKCAVEGPAGLMTLVQDGGVLSSPIASVSNACGAVSQLDYVLRIIDSPIGGGVLRFDGLQVGEDYHGQVNLPTDGSVAIDVGIEAVGHVPNALHEIQLLKDNGGGDLQPMSSIPVTTAGPIPQWITCDANGDEFIDRSDITLIMAARNTPATSPDDRRDEDGDGMISVVDARRCALLCELPGCAARD